MTGKPWQYGSLAAVMSLSLLLGACQSVTQPAGQNTDQNASTRQALAQRHEAMLAERDEFRVDGGLGIWTDEENLSARLLWEQTPQVLHLTLEGPLGLGTMQLADTEGMATLHRGNRLLSRGRSADTVLQQGLGLTAPVPLNELAFWVRGLPGNASRIMRDDEGKLSSLQFTDEQGTRWQARFRRYDNWDGVAVPALITASGGPYSVRLLLKNWSYVTKTVVSETPESNNRLSIPGR